MFNERIGIADTISYEKRTNPMKTRKLIAVGGSPGTGKTTLAKELASLMNAVHWNADDVRNNINKDLGFSMEDRIEQARRMGWLCDNVNKAGYNAIADFVKTYGYEPTGADLERINQDSESVGKVSFFANMGILSVTEYVQLPKIAWCYGQRSTRSYRRST